MLARRARSRYLCYYVIGGNRILLTNEIRINFKQRPIELNNQWQFFMFYNDQWMFEFTILYPIRFKQINDVINLECDSYDLFLNVMQQYIRLIQYVAVEENGMSLSWANNLIVWEIWKVHNHVITLDCHNANNIRINNFKLVYNSVIRISNKKIAKESISDATLPRPQIQVELVDEQLA